MQESSVWVWIGKILWSRKWQPTPVFLPEKFQGQKSLAGYSPWGHRQLDTTEWLSTCCLHTQFRHSRLLLSFREYCMLVWELFTIQVLGPLPSASLASSLLQGKLSQAYCVPLLLQRVCLPCSREAFWEKDSSSEETAWTVDSWFKDDFYPTQLVQCCS